MRHVTISSTNRGPCFLTAGTVQECHNENELELPLDPQKLKSDEITTTPTPKTRHGEDREKKKIRDRFENSFL